MSKIAIDFDHTLHDPFNRDPGYRMGKPTPGAVEFVTRLVERGHELYCLTERGSEPKHVEDWMKYFKFPYVRVTDKKERGTDWYVADKNILYRGDFGEVLAIID